MPQEQTPNDEPFAYSDREFLLRLAEQTEHLYTELSGRLDNQLKQLDHIDVMIHEINQFISEHRPALTKALTLLDPGRSMRDYLKRRKTDD
jgi:hypothetical protein